MNTHPPFDDLPRDEQRRLIWTENQWLYIVMGFIGGVLFCLLVQLSIDNLSEVTRSLIPEATGIFVTIVFIDQLNRRRDARNAVKQLQEQLVRDARSTSNEVAKNAVHQLRERGWLEGENGLLAGVDLSGANLQEASLHKANLKGTKLVRANLQAASLEWADLRDADLALANLCEAALFEANLSRADLFSANLKMASLCSADLQTAWLVGVNLIDADLSKTNLQGAALFDSYLLGANLLDANLQAVDLTGRNMMDEQLDGLVLRIPYFAQALFDEDTILPNGTHWTPDTDMRKFTHPGDYTPTE